MIFTVIPNFNSIYKDSMHKPLSVDEQLNLQYSLLRRIRIFNQLYKKKISAKIVYTMYDYDIILCTIVMHNIIIVPQTTSSVYWEHL